MTDHKVNAIGILGIIGAILMIVCVFLNWVDVTGRIDFIIHESSTVSATGWDLYSNDDWKGFTDYGYVPLATLICGIISAIATILPVASDKGSVNKVFGFVALILAIASIVLMVVLRGDIVGTLSESAGIPGLSEFGDITVEVAYGFWIGIAGAALVVIGGIADLARKTS